MGKPLSLKELAFKNVSCMFFNAIVGLLALRPSSEAARKKKIKRVREYFEENLAATVLKSLR